MSEPRHGFLVFEEADPESTFAPALPMLPHPGDGLLAVFAFLPSGAATPFETQDRAEQWMASREGEHGAPFDVPFRSDRLMWRPGRGMCIGTGELIDDELKAFAYFWFCETELARLETAVAAMWPAATGMSNSCTRLAADSWHGKAKSTGVGAPPMACESTS